MNNSNALAEIQSKYPNCNLLLPAATSVQINPFYKCSVMEVVADTAPSSGDIFSVGKVKTGEDGKGKAIYEEVFSPAKPLLMKLATAAGIQFHPEYTTVIRENTNTYVGKAYGAVRLPDGSYKTHMETKRICLDDEESKYRLEFMDKSIMGIHDWRASKAAAEMFKGEWKQETEPNQYGKYDKYYVIADSDREKYIERSILVNMTLLRKTASEKAQTGAILRVIRALLGIKGTYSKAELEKPFVVPTVTFAPDYTDPTVRSAMLQQGMNSMGNMFGASSTPPAISTAFSGEAFSSDFNPEDEIDNPAFVSDQTEDDAVAGEQEKNWFDQEQQTPPQQEPVENESTGYYCDGCGAEINARVYEYSLNKFGRPLGVKSPLEISDKEMLWDVGIAIGGGLSHMYGNMYLNPMDQMAKRKEGIQYYIRYMDDVIILSTDKELLHRYKNMFSDFLGDVLKLRLNNKTAIRPVSHGMEFVGYTIRPFDVRLRKSTSLRMKRHLKTIQELYRDYEIDLDRARSTLMSYKALMDHCDCRALEKKIFEDFVLTHNPKEADTDNG